MAQTLPGLVVWRKACVLTVTEVARNFSAVMDEVERDQEEIILVRKHHDQITR
jgi:hypothetical protein